jgi:hypothetical protein
VVRGGLPYSSRAWAGGGVNVVELGKALLGLGLLLALIGGILLLAGRAGLPLGRLPGDFAWRGKNVQVFFPLATSILVSILLTLLFYLISKLRK